MGFEEVIKRFRKKCRIGELKLEQKELKSQSPWRGIERIVQAKMPEFQKGTTVEVTLSNPQTVKPIMERADKKEIPGILCKIIDDIDDDRLRGKRLVKEALKNGSNNPFLKDILDQLEAPDKASMPVSVIKTSTPGRGRPDGLEQVIETRDLTRPEMVQLRQDFSQKGQTDGDFLFTIHSKGGESIRLAGKEMQVVNIQIDNPSVADTLAKIIQEEPDRVRTLWDWIAIAWAEAIPHIDWGVFEGQVQWKNPSEGIKIVKKLAIFSKIYNQFQGSPLSAHLTAALRRIIIKGAPEQHRMMLATMLAGANTLWDVVEFLKQHRELQQEYKMSFQAAMSFQAKARDPVCFPTNGNGNIKCYQTNRNSQYFQTKNFCLGGPPGQRSLPRNRNMLGNGKDWRKVRPGQAWTQGNVAVNNRQIGSRMKPQRPVPRGNQVQGQRIRFGLTMPRFGTPRWQNSQTPGRSYN